MTIPSDVDLDQEPDHFLLLLIVAVILPAIAPRSISIRSLDGSRYRPSLEGWFPTPIAIGHSEALSSEQPGVDRPCAGTEHRHTSGEHRQEDVNEAAIGLRGIEREGHAKLIKHEERSHYWRPQAGEKKNASSRLD
jgi:hypothetical protein